MLREPPDSGLPVLVPKTRESGPGAVNRSMCSVSAVTATAGRATVRRPARVLVEEKAAARSGPRSGQGLLHTQRPCIQVDVPSLQGEELAGAQPAAERDD